MGISLKELFLISSISHFSMSFYSKLCPKNDLFEFVFYFIPQYLVLKYEAYHQAFYTIILLFSVLFTSKNNYVYTKSTDIISRFRMLLAFLTSLVIFFSELEAVNNAKYSLSLDLYGMNLISVALGMFVYNAGLVSSRTTLNGKVKNFFKCISLGLFIQLSQNFFKIGLNEVKFGEHINIFYMLGILHLLSLVIKTDIQSIFGILCIAFHHYMLKNFLEDRIMYIYRYDFITKNIEGISYILPQIGIFLICQEIGNAISKKRSLIRLCVYNSFFAVLFYFLNRYEDSSFKFHNATYCILILLIGTSHLILFHYLNLNHQLGLFNITHFSSRNMLYVILLSKSLSCFMAYIIKHWAINEIHIGIMAFAYCLSIYYLPLKANQYYHKFITKKHVYY